MGRYKRRKAKAKRKQIQTTMSKNNQPQTPETRRMDADIERRAFEPGVEVRAMGDGKKKLTGYALKWGVRYNMGWFTEEIAREALKEADLTDVRALLNHDPNMVLAMKLTSPTRRRRGTCRFLGSAAIFHKVRGASCFAWMTATTATNGGAKTARITVLLSASGACSMCRL